MELYQTVILTTIGYTSIELIYYFLKNRGGVEKTLNEFGLPWEESDFPQRYIDYIATTIYRIDRWYNDEFSQAVFQKLILQKERAELVKLLERVKLLAEAPKKACEVESFNEYLEFKKGYGDIYKSPHFDLIDCLMKKNNYSLVKKIIEIGDYVPARLSQYLETTLDPKLGENSYELSKVLYLTILKNGDAVWPGTGREGEAMRASVTSNNETFISNILTHFFSISYWSRFSLR